MRLDMHSHTTDSDGAFNFKELIDYAKKKKLTHLAITNHDSLNNLDKAVIYAKKRKIKIIIGVELSTYLNDESVHVLGYFKSLENLENFKKYLESVKQEREERARLMIINLKKYYNIDIDFYSLNHNSVLTRGALANAICKKYNYKKEDLFLKNAPLSSDSKAYIPSTRLDTYLGIQLLRKYDAFISLAHPTLLKKNKIEDILNNEQCNIDAIEAIYPLNKSMEDKYFKKLCKKHNLLYTSGSDFHRLDDKNHGDLAQCYIKGVNARKVLKRIYNK